MTTPHHPSAPADAIVTDGPALLDFADKLDGLASDLETGATTAISKVTDALEKTAKSYTKDGRTAPVFQPMSQSMSIAMEKVGGNVDGLIKTLRNDAQLIRDLVNKVDEREQHAANSYDNIDGPTRV